MNATIEESRCIYTCKIEPDSPKFMEVFAVLQTWMRKKDDEGLRCPMQLREYPSSAGDYQSILSGIMITLQLVGEAGWLVPKDEPMNKKNIHFFGAWDHEGCLHGLASVSHFAIHPACPYKDEKVLLIDSLCAGPGRFLDDSPAPPKGVGTSLLKHIVCWAMEQGFETAVLDTFPQSERFYLNYGFESRDWLPTKALGWMELRNSEKRWDRIASLEKYEHTMCRCDQVPTMTLFKWMSLCVEISFVIKLLTLELEKNGWTLEDPFIRRFVNLPLLYK